MALQQVKAAAIARRKMRWAAEEARRSQDEAHQSLATEVAKWRKTTPAMLTFSDVACSKAPADLGCVYVKSYNPLRNPCVFCGGMEEDLF